MLEVHTFKTGEIIQRFPDKVDPDTGETVN